jgi:hypothetical protein
MLLERKTIKGLFLIVLVLYLSLRSGPLSASSSEDGTRAASFLFIPVGARLLSGPSILAQMGPDASLVFSNPSALAKVEGGNMFLTGSNWLDDVSFSAFGMVVPGIPYGFKVGIGARFLYSGDLQGYDDALSVVKRSSYYDLALNLAVGRSIPWANVDLGLGTTLLRENLAGWKGDGYALTFGATYRLRGNIVDLWLENIGGKLNYRDVGFKLDRRLRLGYGRLLTVKGGNVRVGGEMSVFSSGTKELAVGVDYLLSRHFSLRAGMDHSLTGSESSGFPLKAGFGFHTSGVSVDYAFISRKYFAGTHTFSLSFPLQRFDASGEKRGGAVPAGVSKSARSGPERVMPAGPERTALEDRPPLSRRGETSQGSYLIIGGMHSRKESAQAEVQALRRENLAAVIREVDGSYLVSLGEYTDKRDAKKALERLRSAGYDFTLFELPRH